MFGAFNVTPSGTVWVAVFNQKGETFAYSFDSKGELSQRVHLSSLAWFQPQSIAAFETDRLVLKGHFASMAAPERANKPYVALFAPSGDLLQELSLKVPAFDAKVERKQLPEGAIVIGSDGNAYVLLPDRVAVISQSGNTVRTLPFDKYDREARAVNMFVSGGLVAVVFYKPVKQFFDATLLVLDANTGEPFGYYKPAAELGNNAICFNRTDGFIFMGMNPDGRIKLQSAALR